MQRVLVINGILSLSIVSSLDPLSRCRYYWKNESIRCSCLRKSRWKWQCKIDRRRLCFWTLILNFTILIVATENPGCQPLCYQKDHCPRNAGCGPANSQCVTAQICPTGRRRQSPFLPLDAGLDHLVHHSTGTSISHLTSLQSRMHWICRLWLRYCQWPSICSVIVGLSGKNIAYRHSSSTTSHWDACSLLAPWTFSLPDLIQLLKSRLLPPSSSSSLEPWMLTKPRMKNYSWYSIIQP